MQKKNIKLIITVVFRLHLDNYYPQTVIASCMVLCEEALMVCQLKMRNYWTGAAELLQ